MVELIGVFPHHLFQANTYVYQKHMLYILFPPLCVYSILKDKLEIKTGYEKPEQE